MMEAAVSCVKTDWQAWNHKGPGPPSTLITIGRHGTGDGFPVALPSNHSNKVTL